MADAPLELYDGTALEWVLDSDEVRVEADEAMVRALVANAGRVTESTRRDG